VGYDPPAEAFKDILAKMKAGGPESYKGLSAAYAKNPKDVATVFALAEKKNERYPADQVAPLYKQVVALDPDGKAGMTEYRKEKVSYTELAEFKIGLGAVEAGPPPKVGDPAPLLAFVKKYPESAIVKEAYGGLANWHYSRAETPKADAYAFFDAYTARYALDPMALWSYMRRIIADKDNLDKGIELGRKAADLAAPAMKMMLLQSLAEIYLLKGDKAQAAEVAERILKEASGGGAVMMLAATSAGDMPVSLPPGGDMGAANAARIFVRADRMDRALAVYGPDYLKKNGDKAQPVTAYASFWSSQNANLESALEAAQKATALNAGSWTPWNIRAQLELKLKRYDAALQSAQKALELAPAQPAQFKAGVQKTIDQIKAAAGDKK